MHINSPEFNVASVPVLYKTQNKICTLTSVTSLSCTISSSMESFLPGGGSGSGRKVSSKNSLMKNIKLFLLTITRICQRHVYALQLPASSKVKSFAAVSHFVKIINPDTQCRVPI